MRAFKKKSWLESIFVLVLISVLAGLAGGGAVGYITGRTPSAAAPPK